MSDIKLQDLIDLSALNAAKQVVEQVDSGNLDPEQGELMCSILMTAFNSIYSNSDFLELMTETSKYISNRRHPAVIHRYSMVNEAKDVMTITIANNTVSLKSKTISKRFDLDTKAEAFKKLNSVLDLLIKKGYRVTK